MAERKIKLRHVSGKPVEGNLHGRQLVFTHIHKAAGTTLDWIMAGVAWRRSEKIFRVAGTIYGQHLEGYVDSIASLHAAKPETLAAARFLVGHLPTTAWDEIRLDKKAAFLTILRDPVERMISHFRFGISRGGWQADTSIPEIIKAGLLVDNLQVRQISGCRDASEPCTEVMLEEALKTLSERYALIGMAEDFDAILSTLIKLCGWPDIIYSKYQVGDVILDDERMSALREECRRFNQFDQMLVNAVKTHGPVQVNLVEREPPPPADDSVVVVAAELKEEENNYPVFPKTELDDFEAWVRGNNASFTRA